MKILPSLLKHAAEDAALRRDIHAHPELGFDEHRTAKLVAERLRSWGIETHTGIGGTGVVGVIKKGQSQRSIALRADMDALPITEQNHFEHASRHPGKMHACGHDGHTATLLAAARVLSQETQFDGTVVLIFQPAEETVSGAKAMIEDGLFERFPIDVIYGFHNRPAIELGHFDYKPGTACAATVSFKLVLQGRGAHAAVPDTAINPLPAGCQLVQAFESIMANNKRPIDAGIISVTMFNSGEAINAIPAQCVIQGSVRCVTDDVLNTLQTRMNTVIEHTAAAYGLKPSLHWINYCPGIRNNGPALEVAHAVMLDLAGKDKIHLREFSLGCEDFGYYLQHKPGAYVTLGTGTTHRDEGHGDGPCSLHNASYDFNDALIPIGATYWVHLVEKWLAVI